MIYIFTKFTICFIFSRRIIFYSLLMLASNPVSPEIFFLWEQHAHALTILLPFHVQYFYIRVVIYCRTLGVVPKHEMKLCIECTIIFFSDL